MRPSLDIPLVWFGDSDQSVISLVPCLENMFGYFGVFVVVVPCLLRDVPAFFTAGRTNVSTSVTTRAAACTYANIPIEQNARGGLKTLEAQGSNVPHAPLYH